MWSAKGQRGSQRCSNIPPTDLPSQQTKAVAPLVCIIVSALPRHFVHRCPWGCWYFLNICGGSWLRSACRHTGIFVLWGFLLSGDTSRLLWGVHAGVALNSKPLHKIIIFGISYYYISVIRMLKYCFQQRVNEGWPESNRDTWCLAAL